MFPAMVCHHKILFENFGNLDVLEVEGRWFYARWIVGTENVVVRQKVANEGDSEANGKG